MTTDLGRCTKQVSDNEGWATWYQCKRNAKMTFEGNRFCTQHDPIKRAERHSKADEQLRAKWSREDYDRVAGNYCRAKGLTIEELT